ncbi:MAG: hypothetical protein ABFD60_11425 [Bryobacteraceae bacterium]
MAFIRRILSYYSYAFNGLFAAFLLGIAAISFLTGSHAFQFPILPWEDNTLVYALVGIAVIGFLMVLLAMIGTAKKLFLIWSLLVFALIVRGFFFSSHQFAAGSGDICTALYVVAASIIAVLGAGMAAVPDLRRR